MTDDRAIDLVRAVNGAIAGSSSTMTATVQDFLEWNLDSSYLKPVLPLLATCIQTYMERWKDNKSVYDKWQSLLLQIRQKLPATLTAEEILYLQDLVNAADDNNSLKQSVAAKLQTLLTQETI